MKNIKIINEKASMGFIKVKNAVTRTLNNERGDGLLAGLIFTALIVLAVIGMKTYIDGGFSALGVWFQTKIVEKIKSTLI